MRNAESGGGWEGHLVSTHSQPATGHLIVSGLTLLLERRQAFLAFVS